MVCRKHVREVHVGKKFDILKVEVKLSPDLLVFKRFRKFSAKLYLGQSQISNMEIPVVGWNPFGCRKLVRILNNLRTQNNTLNLLLYLGKSNR